MAGGSLVATLDLLLKYSDETLATYIWNCWNIRNICLNTYKNTWNTWSHCKIYVTSGWNTCNICVKYMQHLDKHTSNTHLKNKSNIWNRSLQHTCIAIATYATSRSTLICNIHIKLLQHNSETSESLEIYACHMRFQLTSPCLGEWRLISMWSLP
jgi:hypothetical protein